MLRLSTVLSLLAFFLLLSAPADARIALTGGGIGNGADFDGTEGTVELFEDAPGNLDVVVCSTFSSGANDFLTPVPGGWSPAAESSCGGGSCILGVYTKPAGAGLDETTCMWTQNTDVYTAAILRYAGADADDPVIASACQSGISANITAPSVATEANSTVLRVIAIGGDQLLQPNQEFLEAIFTSAAVSATEQFSFIVGLSSYVPIAEEVEQMILPIGIPVPWTACTIALRGAATPIPAMSEWGLIAFAGMAGIASLLVIRRRTRTA